MDEFYRRGFGVLSVAVLGYALFQVLTPFWGALAWSICLAVLLAPLQHRLTRRFGDRPNLAVVADGSRTESPPHDDSSLQTDSLLRNVMFHALAEKTLSAALATRHKHVQRSTRSLNMVPPRSSSS